jgi:uncharacterized protein (TIGR00730 family)
MPSVSRLCVYCGSSTGNDPAYAAAARQLGRSMTARQLDLVYGGGHIGLMGLVAEEVLAGGREVTGVITEHLMDREVGHDGLTELVVVADMPARKDAMFRRADAFVALPGGVGTMEELFEVLCWRYLGLHPKPVGLLNVSGYYDHLVAFLERATADGFLRASDLVVTDDVDALLDAIVAGMAEAA